MGVSFVSAHSGNYFSSDQTFKRNSSTDFIPSPKATFFKISADCNTFPQLFVFVKELHMYVKFESYWHASFVFCIFQRQIIHFCNEYKTVFCSRCSWSADQKPNDVRVRKKCGECVPNCNKHAYFNTLHDNQVIQTVYIYIHSTCWACSNIEQRTKKTSK